MECNLCHIQQNGKSKIKTTRKCFSQHEDLATLRLKKQEDFWILRLKPLEPDGLNAELNFLMSN